MKSRTARAFDKRGAPRFSEPHLTPNTNMTDTPQTPDSMSEPHSHLKDHLAEVVASLRIEAMDLLARELMVALERENYRLDELLHALAGYTDLQPGWGEVTSLLESASSKIADIRRQSEGLSSHE